MVLVGAGEAVLAGDEVEDKVGKAGISSVGPEQAANTITKNNKQINLCIEPRII
jgi:hypothetical protein